MTINNIEFKIDFTDAEVVQKIEEGSKQVYEEAEKLKTNKDLPLAEGIRQECKIIKDFIDYVLGNGTSEKLFENRNSLQECTNAFTQILEARDNQYKTFVEKVNKYSPDRVSR